MPLACSDTTAPENDPSLDAALAELARLSGFATVGAPSTGGVVVPASASGCTFRASTQRFVCAPDTRDGIRYERYFVLLDAAGDVLAQFGPEVSAIRSVVDYSGTSVLLRMTVSSHQESTLSGLRTNMQRLIATGTTMISRETGGSRPDRSTHTQSTDLTLPDRDSGRLYPIGTVATHTVVEGLPGGSTTTTTFDGTSIVTWVLSSGTSTLACTVDLAAPEPRSVCH